MVMLVLDLLLWCVTVSWGGGMYVGKYDSYYVSVYLHLITLQVCNLLIRCVKSTKLASIKRKLRVFRYRAKKARQGTKIIRY